MTENVRLENPLPWEKIEVIIKRHWIVYVIIGAYFFSAILLTVALIFFLFSTVWIYILMIMFWMFFLLFSYVQWLDHELDLFIITNFRIIWIEQVSLLNRIVSECSLSQIQEVWSKTQWFFANILNYWTITMQTAWNATNFIMEFAPDAIHTSSMILNIINTYRDTTLKKDDIWSQKPLMEITPKQQ